MGWSDATLSAVLCWPCITDHSPPGLSVGKGLPATCKGRQTTIGSGGEDLEPARDQGPAIPGPLPGTSGLSLSFPSL